MKSKGRGCPLRWQDHQLFWRFGQVDAAVFNYEQHILNSHTKFSGQIDAGFCGQHCTRRDSAFAALGGTRFLVDFQPDTVAESMPEGFDISGGGDYLAGGCINRLSGHTGFCGGNPCELCVQHSAVDPFHFLCRMSYSNRARHI